MKYPHWQYYLSLVDDVDRLSRYVELATDNFATYSVECTRILLAAASEIYVVAKILCGQVSPGSDARSIVDYGEILLPNYPGLSNVEVTIPRCDLTFIPWRDWTMQQRPQWWQSYNNVKHERHKYAGDANLGNSLKAVAGLCVLLSYLHYEDFIYKGLATRRPFFFLDRKYDSEAALVTCRRIALPDLARPATH